MCGLAGFSGKQNFDDEKFRMLLLYNQTRGEDSTGVYIPKEGVIIKDTKKAFYWLADNKFQQDTLAIGHTRAKTRGANTIKNAHPFKYGTTIGAHNGTLKNHYDLIKNHELRYADFDVDSQVIFKLLDKYKNPKVLYEFEGAAAVLFTNEVENTDKSKTLYVFRNNERPLFKGMSEEGMYISSLEESLKAIKCTDIEAFEINKLHKIVDGEIVEVLDIPREEKDKETNTTTTRTTTTNYGVIGIQRYPIGSYITPDPGVIERRNKARENKKEEPFNLTIGKYYRVVSHKKENNRDVVVLVDDKGKEDWFAPVLFSYTDILKVVQNGYAKAIMNLKGKDKTRICNKDALVHILYLDEKTGEIDFSVAEKPDKIYSGVIHFFRPLFKSEHEEMKAAAEAAAANVEEEDDEIDGGLPSLGDKEVSGHIVDEFIDNLTADLIDINSILKQMNNGYLKKEEQKALDSKLGEIHSSIYEFVYEAGDYEYQEEPVVDAETCKNDDKCQEIEE